jgi:carboxyl-terminal processing protease
MTRPRVLLRGAGLALAVVGLFFCTSPATAQLKPVLNDPAIQPIAPSEAPPAGAELDDVVSRGHKLESQRRWGEALSLYEETFRNNPKLVQLDERIDLAKIHYDLGRRCADGSFRRGIPQLDETRALDLYTEVLTKIYSHYVQDPDWKHLVERGTLDLEVALGEPAFADYCRLQANPQEINDFRRRLHQLLDGRTVRDRNEARDIVADVAHLAKAQLGLNPTAAILEYTSGAAGGLDEYSTFLTADQLNDLYSQIEGNFVGLGVELKAVDNALLIVNVIHGSPADRGGVKAGDRLTAVAGKSTRELTTDQAAELLQGQEGSSVEVTAVTGTEPPRQLVLRREHVEVPSIDDVRIIDQESGIGYLKLTCFQKTTSRDLDTALWKLYRLGVKSLVMDLRGNPGGLLNAAVDVSDKFIDEGNIVSTRGRSPQEDYNYTAHSTGVWRMPLVVLIDGDSASASEIFAGAIRDHRRGLIVGTRSYGKGSVQGIFPLNIAGTGLRLTTAKFYSPNGHPFVRVGVEPDIVVRQAAKPIEGQISPAAGDKSDAILAAGLQAARRQLAQR